MCSSYLFGRSNYSGVHFREGDCSICRHLARLVCSSCSLAPALQGLVWVWFCRDRHTCRSDFLHRLPKGSSMSSPAWRIHHQSQPSRCDLYRSCRVGSSMFYLPLQDCPYCSDDSRNSPHPHRAAMATASPSSPTASPSRCRLRAFGGCGPAALRKILDSPRRSSDCCRDLATQNHLRRW